jgi:tetratricopeptide (TPR) repeat protein
MKIRPATIKAIATLAASFFIFSCAGIPAPEPLPTPPDVLPDTQDLPQDAPDTTVIQEPAKPVELTAEEKEAIELAGIQVLIGEGRLAEAAERFGALGKARPDNREYPVLQASLLLSSGSMDDARSVIKEELADHPGNLRALFMLGQIERFSGNQRAFQATVEAIIKQDPRNPDANASMGDIQYTARNYTRAEQSYVQALAADPAHVEALIGLARVQYRRNALRPALENLDKAVAITPDDPRIFLDRSRVRYQLGQYAGSEADLNASIELAPDSSWAYVERGRLYLDTGRIEQAEADFNRSIQIDPDYFLPYVYRASIYENSGRDSLALADHRKVTRLNPDYWYAFESVGVLAWRLGDWPLVHESFIKALSYTTNHPEYHILAALGLMRSGSVRAARDYASRNLPRIDRTKYPAHWLMLRLIFDQGNTASELELRINSEKILDLKAGMLFYLGAYWASRDLPQLGATYLGLSLDLQRIGTMERRMAEAELARLQNNK